MMWNQEIIRLRLINQQIDDLVHRTNKNPEVVVASMGAMQAQDHLASLWAIGLRCGRSTLASVEGAIAERTIVRTWLMRGTLHYVASADVRWMLRLLAPRLTALSLSRERVLGLSGDVVSRSKRLMSKSLEGGRQLTRGEMYDVLEKGGISAKRLGYHLLHRAATDGLICLGAHAGKAPTFALLDEWVGNRNEVSDEQALGELASRYFASRGPATVKDFVWWSGLTTSAARSGVEDASPALVEKETGGTTFFMPQSGSPSAASSGQSAHLLPAFDEYLVGYRDRSAMLGSEETQKMLRSGKITFTHPNGIFLPTILIDGEIIGTWQRTQDKERVSITLRPFRGLDEEALEGISLAAERYGEFLGVPAILSEG